MRKIIAFALCAGFASAVWAAGDSIPAPRARPKKASSSASAGGTSSAQASRHSSSGWGGFQEKSLSAPVIPKTDAVQDPKPAVVCPAGTKQDGPYNCIRIHPTVLDCAPGMRPDGNHCIALPPPPSAPPIICPAGTKLDGGTCLKLWSATDPKVDCPAGSAVDPAGPNNACVPVAPANPVAENTVPLLR